MLKKRTLKPIAAVLGITFVIAIAASPIAIAYRYALVNLNPFIIESISAQADAEIYEIHDQNDELNLFNQETGKGLTEQYIEDSAELMVALIKRNIDDIPNEDTVNSNITDKVLYDIDQDIRISFRQSQNEKFAEQIRFGSDNSSSMDRLIGGNREDHLYGNKGNDVLAGEKDKDYLEGNEGNDFLFGIMLNGGDDDAPDTLRGGADHDTYFVGNGDKINDIDRDGSVYAAGLDISGEYFRSAGFGSGNEYILNEDDRYISLSLNDTEANIYVRNSVTGQTAIFTIQNIKESGSNFNNGNFGITLNDQPVHGELLIQAATGVLKSQ